MKKNILLENMRRFGTKNLKEQEELDDLLDIIMSYVKDPDDAEKELDNFLLHGVQGFSDAVAANVTRDPRFDKFKR
jgi:hypothetical protein